MTHSSTHRLIELCSRRVLTHGCGCGCGSVQVTLTRQIGESRVAAVPLTERAMRFFQKTKEDAGGMGLDATNKSVVHDENVRCVVLM